MADIGNQLEGASDGLGRFLDALDTASMKMGSNAAIEAKVARDQLRSKAKITKQDKEHLKRLTETNKNMKLFNKNLTDFGKKILGGLGKSITNIAKAGVLGGMVGAVKLITDGLLKSDAAMAKLAGRVGMTRKELSGVKDEAAKAQVNMNLFGVTTEQSLAAAGNLVEAFGNVNMVTGKTIENAMRLEKVYGLSSTAAANLVEHMSRANMEARSFIDNIANKASAAGVSVSLVMRDVASRTQQMAMHGERGVDAMVKMAVVAAKAGTNMKDAFGDGAAFGDMGTITKNMGELESRFGGISDAIGRPDEVWAAFFEGGEAMADKQEDITKALAKQLDYSKEKGFIDKEGRKVEAGWIKFLASSLDRDIESMGRMIKEQDKLDNMNADERKAYDKQQKKEVNALDRENQILKDQQTIIERLSNIWTGLYNTLAAQLNEVLSPARIIAFRASIEKMGEALKRALSLNTFAEDIEKGGWAKALGSRVSGVLKLAIQEAFGVKDVDMGAIAKIAGGMAALGGVVKVMSALKGTWANPMVVTMAGGGGVGGAGPKVRGAAGTAYDTARGRGAGRVAAATSAAKQAGKGSMVKGVAKLGGKALGKGLLKKIPLLGVAAGMYFAYDRIGRGDYLGGLLELGSGVASILPGFGTAASAAIDLSLAAKDTAAMTAGATGLMGHRGPALVGEEGRGEVVVSRSALRSGVGVGGRAASALAGIGVPGFRTGYASADTSAITGRQGLQGAYGSQSFKSSQANAFQEEQAKQQASMMEYWRQHYEDKMDQTAEGKSKQGPPWLAQFFIKYNKEIGAQLKKTGPTFSAAIMTGMTKWSKGGSLTEAMTVGAKAGITAGLNDPGSKLNELLGKMGGLGDVAKAGMAAFAGGKNVKRAVVGAGARSLAGYIQGGGNFGFGGKKGPEAAAQGKYVNSPTLMMVGEEGRGEVVIPTERIRKGLPINAGVAKELGSIGVPGFFGGGIAGHRAAGNVVPPVAPPAAPSGGGGGAMSGLEAGGRASAAAGLTSFANIYEQTGDWKQAASGGVGAGIGAAAGLGLGALGIPPPLSTMIGGAIGGLATKGINKIFKITGGYGKGRKRSLKLIENHIKTGGRFDFGAPSGLSGAMGLGVGGYEKTPTEANFNKMVETLGTSRLVASMGIPAPALIALAQGQTGGNQASKLYSTINSSLYGNTPDRYRKALSIPALAAGGIVNRPTTALIGERGPEAVVPLGNSEMMQELKKQNKLMAEMIQTQKDTAQTEIRMDGRVVSEVVGQNFYDIGNGL